MVDNINTNSMVGKVIAVLIALLFVTVLAFPIANSLSNMGKGGDDSAPITYTNTGDHYYKSTANDDTVHTVQLSVEWENLTETEGHDTYSLSIDDSVIDSYTNTWDDSNPTYPVVVMPIGWGSGDIFAVSIFEFLFCETNGMTPITPDIKVISESSDSGAGGTPSIQEPTYPNSGSEGCSFTVQNGVITYINNNDETVTSEYHMDYLITADDSGEYVLADTPFKTDRNSMLYVCEVGNIDNSEHNKSFPVMIYGSMNTSVLTSSPVSVPLQFHGMEGTILSTVTSTNDKGMITVSKIESDISMTIPDREGSYTISDTVSLKAIVPTTVTIDPSAPVEVTVTNSGQTYKELDDNSHNIHTETTTNGDINTVTVFSDNAEIMSFNRINEDFTPKICLAFGSEGSVWLTNAGYLLMINSNGGVVNMYGSSASMNIINKTYDSHTFGTVNLEYFISNDGEYVYSDTATASKTGQIYNIGISLCDVGDTYPIFASVQSNGTPVSALNDVHVDGYNVTTVNSTAHYTVGDYVNLDGLDVTYSFTFDGTDYTVDYSTSGFFVPKTFTYESPDSGSDSEGLGGIASTLVKLVPILLIVSLLLVFIVPMVYKPN